MGCFSVCLMSFASDQKLFCGVFSVFKCSFDEFVGEKVVSLSYCSAIFQSPPQLEFEPMSPEVELQNWHHLRKDYSLM